MGMQRAVLWLACVARAAALATGVRGAASPPPRAMIAGGGIGGLFTAITLRNEGYDVSVFEKTREYRSFGGPIQIASNGLEAVPSRGLTRFPLPQPLARAPPYLLGSGPSPLVLGSVASPFEATRPPSKGRPRICAPTRSQVPRI